MKSVIIIGIIIAVIIIGGGSYYINSIPPEVSIDETPEETPEGKQYVLELSDSMYMEGT